MFQEQVQQNFHCVFTHDILTILSDGIARGIAMGQEELEGQRRRLGYYAQNTEQRDVFSAMCKGLEEILDKEKNLLLQYQHSQSTSSYYIEIFNADLFLHVHKSTGELPKYMKEKCKMNTSFEKGKQNYGVIEFDEDQKTGKVMFVRIAVYDVNGVIAYKEEIDMSTYREKTA